MINLKSFLQSKVVRNRLLVFCAIRISLAESTVRISVAEEGSALLLRFHHVCHVFFESHLSQLGRPLCLPVRQYSGRPERVCVGG
jgi:hypothetical protein